MSAFHRFSSQICVDGIDTQAETQEHRWVPVCLQIRPSRLRESVLRLCAFPGLSLLSGPSVLPHRSFNLNFVIFITSNQVVIPGCPQTCEKKYISSVFLRQFFLCFNFLHLLFYMYKYLPPCMYVHHAFGGQKRH